MYGELVVPLAALSTVRSRRGDPELDVHCQPCMGSRRGEPGLKNRVERTGQHQAHTGTQILPASSRDFTEDSRSRSL